ncbi:MAG: ribonuclease III [Caldilineaceae bacterium]
MSKVTIQYRTDYSPFLIAHIATITRGHRQKPQKKHPYIIIVNGLCDWFLVFLCMRVLNYQFSNPALLEEALLHPSARDESNRDYQRLEFLGDSVLGFVVTEMLGQLFPDEEKGSLVKRRGYLVSGPVLAEIARQWGLHERLVVSAPVEEDGTHAQDAALEDACEAVIGALFLDGGIDVVREIILPVFETLALQDIEPPQNPKNELQEWAQQQGLPRPTYRIIGKDGPDHAPVFEVEVEVEGEAPARATAGSKREAQTLAASCLMEQIRSQYGQTLNPASPRQGK